MAKKCMINRNKKRKQLAEKFSERRLALKNIIAENRGNMEEVFKAQQELAKLPRASSRTRSRNICFITGRSRGNLSRFQLSRIEFRRLASFADIPGVKKSSW